MRSVFRFIWLSCQYLPSGWLERLLWGRLTAARGSSSQSLGLKSVYDFAWFSVLFHCIIMRLSCPQSYIIYFIHFCWKMNRPLPVIPKAVPILYVFSRHLPGFDKHLSTLSQSAWQYCMSSLSVLVGVSEALNKRVNDFKFGHFH